MRFFAARIISIIFMVSALTACGTLSSTIAVSDNPTTTQIVPQNVVTAVTSRIDTTPTVMTLPTITAISTKTAPPTQIPTRTPTATVFPSPTKTALPHHTPATSTPAPSATSQVDPETEAVAFLHDRLQKDQVYGSNLDCIAFLPEETTATYVSISVHHNNGDACGGDPTVFPTLDRYRVMRATYAIMVLDVLSDTYIPYSGPKSRVTPTPSPTVPGVKGKIVYTSMIGDGPNYPIYLMNADGSSQTQIGEGSSPAFSSLGSVAYIFEPKNPTRAQKLIVSIRADGSAKSELCPIGSEVTDLLSWSPDGRYIATGTRSTGHDAGTLGFCDTITHVYGPQDEWKPFSLVYGWAFDWTPDGKDARLFQLQTGDPATYNIYYGQLGRGDVPSYDVTHGQNPYIWPDESGMHYYADARVSPDGKTIAVSGSKVFFVAVPNHQSPFAGKGSNTAPRQRVRWSPDSRSIAIGIMLPPFTGWSFDIVDIATGKVTLHVDHAALGDWTRT